MEPHCGPGACGLDNLGNSCYLNAVMQVLLHLRPVLRLLETRPEEHRKTCAKDPSECVMCQFEKVAEAMHEGGCGRSVVPRLLKQAIGKKNAMFASNKQQGDDGGSMR